MEKIKLFLVIHLEKILVLLILISIAIITYFISYKLVFLHFFYLPIIIAGYYLGKRFAVLSAVFCITGVLLSVVLFPSAFFISGIGKTYLIASLIGWSSFLILISAALGYLYEEKENRIKDLKAAYIGVLEIMSKYLESAHRYTKGHSVRVAHLAEDIAIAMSLPRLEVENVKAAALLHDIGKIEISIDILDKAAALSREDKEVMSTHPEKGAKILTLVGGILKEAVPLVLAHHKYYFNPQKFSTKEADQIPIGTAIIAVADTYDALITDRPYRAGKLPWKAYEIIEKDSGKQFHPEVIKAFKQVLSLNEKYRMEIE